MAVLLLCLAIIPLSGAGAATVGGAPGRTAPVDPDWPCVQIQVPTLAAGQIWTGESIDGREEAYRRLPELEQIVSQALDRRAAVEDVETAIAERVKGWSSAGTPPAELRSILTDLFAGIFAGANDQRGEMLEAIKRYARQQRQRLDSISVQLGDLAKLPAGSVEHEALARSIEFQRRIVDERRRSQVAICEQPVRLERRLGRLARAIAGHLPPP